MGLLKDALNLGYINLDDYNDLAQSWSDYGYDARHYGAVDAFQAMTEDLSAMGFSDLAETAFQEMQDSIEHYQTEYDYTIAYDSEIGAWYSLETNEYIPDPYEWIRD